MKRIGIFTEAENQNEVSTLQPPKAGMYHTDKGEPLSEECPPDGYKRIELIKGMVAVIAKKATGNGRFGTTSKGASQMSPALAQQAADISRREDVDRLVAKGVQLFR